MNRFLPNICRALSVLLITVALVASVAESAAQQVDQVNSLQGKSPFVKMNEENLLVLEVRIEKKGTGSGLLAYQYKDDVFLPLGEICAILELAIMVDPDRGIAQGWIIEENRTFDLNLPAQTISLNGNLMPLTPKTVGLDKDDIFVLAKVLENWLPVDLDFSIPRMTVTISPRETLPFQSRLIRDGERSMWLASKGQELRNYPMQRAPYRLWSWPLVDATLGLNFGHNKSSRRLSLGSNADLGGLSTNLFLTHSATEDNSKTTARLKAGRWNPEGTLLGPASATRYEFGDLFISRVPLISSSKQGLGAMITNQRLNQSWQFNTTEIQGDAPPGWEAELYINGSLYEFQVIGDSGQFFFAGVPLIVGNNTFRTVLRGPRGETREVVKNAVLSPEMSDVGELKYKVTVVREGRGLLTAQGREAGPQAGQLNQQLEMAYALSHSHAMVANFSRLNVGEQTKLFSSLSSHNSLGRVYLETILATSGKGSAAGLVGARTAIHGQNIFAQFNVNDNYQAEDTGAPNFLKREAILRISGNLTGLYQRPLFYNFTVNNRIYTHSDIKQDNEVKLTLSKSIKRFHLSHNIRHRSRQLTSSRATSTTGTQLLRTLLGPISVGAEINYEISPSRLRSAGASVSWSATDRVQLSGRGSHFLGSDQGQGNLNADLTVFLDKFSLGANYSYTSSGGSAIGIKVGTFITRDNRSNNWMVHRRPAASRSVASVRAFIDLNGNGVFDEGDEPLPGIGFQNLTVWEKIRTNEDGIALLTGLAPNRVQTIKVDRSTQTDPFLIPLVEGINVVGHPGSFVDVEFPFSYMGEMEGRVIESGQEEKSVRHVGLEILDSNNNRLLYTVAEFDGYYYFPKILPGEYRLGVIEATISPSRYQMPEPVSFTIPPEGGYVEGPIIILNQKLVIDPPFHVIAAISPELEDVPQKQVPSALPSAQEAGATPRPSLPEMTGAKMTMAPASKVANEGHTPLAAAPDFDEDLTLSLIFEILYRNSLWPDETVQ